MGLCGAGMLRRCDVPVQSGVSTRRRRHCSLPDLCLDVYLGGGNSVDSVRAADSLHTHCWHGPFDTRNVLHGHRKRDHMTQALALARIYNAGHRHSQALRALEIEGMSPQAALSSNIFRCYTALVVGIAVLSWIS